MKKTYLKPEMISLNVVSESIMIPTSGNTTVDPNNPLGPGSPEEARGHRGEWGNVWAN